MQSSWINIKMAAISMVEGKDKATMFVIPDGYGETAEEKLKEIFRSN